MRKATFILLAAMTLTACEERAERVSFDGIYFPTKSSKASEDRQDFVATVRRADRNPDLAREAGRYEGTQYCLQNFGTSNIDWTRGPDDSVTVSNGRLTFEGRCIIW